MKIYLDEWIPVLIVRTGIYFYIIGDRKGKKVDKYTILYSDVIGADNI